MKNANRGGGGTKVHPPLPKDLETGREPAHKRLIEGIKALCLSLHPGHLLIEGCRYPSPATPQVKRVCRIDRTVTRPASSAGGGGVSTTTTPSTTTPYSEAEKE